MIDLGYRDKSYLCNYNLEEGLFSQFGLTVYDLAPVRKVYTLITNKGDKILKKIDCTLEEYQFIIDAANYIKLSYKKIANFIETDKNEKFINWKGEIYCVMDKVPGRECEYSNPVDLSMASKAIGEFHKASEGFRHKNASKYICGNFINNLKRKKEEMLFFKNMALIYENKREFDEIFLAYADYYIEKIQDSISILEGTQYYKLCSEEDKIVLCHHDLAHHNIIIDNNDVYFIDFDFSVIDLKVHDLCNFINKVTKIFAFDIEKAKLILNNYCKTNEICKKEFEVLYGMLVFPEDFYEIAKDYYTKRKEWEEQVFVSKLKRKINFEKDRKEFLENFKNTYVV